MAFYSLPQPFRVGVTLVGRSTQRSFYLQGRDCLARTDTNKFDKMLFLVFFVCCCCLFFFCYCLFFCFVYVLKSPRSHSPSSTNTNATSFHRTRLAVLRACVAWRLATSTRVTRGGPPVLSPRRLAGRQRHARRGTQLGASATDAGR